MIMTTRLLGKNWRRLKINEQFVVTPSLLNSVQMFATIPSVYDYYK